MPRPKGSKNKKTAAVENNAALEAVSDIDAHVAAAADAIKTLTEELKAKKAELKHLTKAKAKAEKAAAEKKAAEDKAQLLEAVEASGKSMDEIMSFLKG